MRPRRTSSEVKDGSAGGLSRPDLHGLPKRKTEPMIFTSSDVVSRDQEVVLPKCIMMVSSIRRPRCRLTSRDQTAQRDDGSSNVPPPISTTKPSLRNQNVGPDRSAMGLEIHFGRPPVADS